MYLTIKHFILFSFLIVGFKSSYAQKQTIKVREYYENGVIKTKGKLKNDTKSGIWFFYANNGKLILKEVWRKGVLKYSTRFNEQQKAFEILFPDGSTRKLRTCGC